MKHKKVQHMLEKVSPVHSALTSMISTLKLAVEIVDKRSPAEQAELVEYWQARYLTAVQQLEDALPCFASTARAIQPVLVVAPRRRGFATTPRRHNYR